MKIAISSSEKCEYQHLAPFHPSVRYPEYPFSEPQSMEEKGSCCDAYAAVREALHLLGYDSTRYGRAEWNPLGGLVRPDTTVVIKPNFVLHHNEGGHDLEAIITHPSVIRPVIDYCYIAMQGRGRVIIAEAPQMDCDMADLRSAIKLDEMIQFYNFGRDFSVSFMDLRQLRCTWDNERELYPSESFVNNESADPKGYTICNLGCQSELDTLPGLDRLYGADYDRKFTVAHHHRGVHEYKVARTVLDADAVILLPKMKTHKKTGITLGMKLLVGINGDKNYLAHFRVGDPSSGGDEYPTSSSKNVKLKRVFSRLVADVILKRRSRWTDQVGICLTKTIRLLSKCKNKLGIASKSKAGEKICAGNWYGNDTAWRMAADLSRIFLYSDNEGVLQKMQIRKMLVIADGIVAGEGDGPLAAESCSTNTVVAGENILAVDTAATTMMGFDYNKIPMLRQSWFRHEFPLSEKPIQEYVVVSNLPVLNNKSITQCRRFSLRPPRNWLGHVELP